MGKKNGKGTDAVIVNESVAAPVNTLETMTREELKTRYNDNIATRKALAEENQMLVQLYRTASSSAKKSSAEAQIAKLQERLAALTNPTVVIGSEDISASETPAELAM